MSQQHANESANQPKNPILVCLGNPLLDMQAPVDAAYLSRHGLASNDAVLIQDSKNELMAVFAEVLKNPDVILVAGGAAQNTARGAAYVMGPGTVGYFGCVGSDEYAKRLLAQNEKAGVRSMYQVSADVGTGKCAALITGHDRSLVTDLGAANHFQPEHLDKHWDTVEAAKAFYIGGFHLTVSPDAICKLGEHAGAHNKPLVLNLSAPFIPLAFGEALDRVIPYATVVIANESEAAAYKQHRGLACSDDDLETIARDLVSLPGRERTVIFTHGTEPTLVVAKDFIKTFPVHALEPSRIADTNGAGDAFAGGFVAGLSANKDLNTCIDMGHWLASLSIQEIGPSYPKERIEYQH